MNACLPSPLSKERAGGEASPFNSLKNMTDPTTLFQWVILSLTALCIGMSKTGVQGLMLLVVPYMAMAFGAKESTGVILPMLAWPTS